MVNDKKELYYQCQIIPKRIGCHELWVKYNGHHIEESPVKVHFKPRGDATKCAMVSSSKFHQEGGNVSFQISTSGTGEGILVATVGGGKEEAYILEGGIPSRNKTTSFSRFNLTLVQCQNAFSQSCTMIITYLAPLSKCHFVK